MNEKQAEKMSKFKELMYKDLTDETQRPSILTGIYFFVIIAVAIPIVSSILNGSEVSIVYVGLTILILVILTFNIGLMWRKYRKTIKKND